MKSSEPCKWWFGGVPRRMAFCFVNFFDSFFNWETWKQALAPALGLWQIISGSTAWGGCQCNHIKWVHPVASYPWILPTKTLVNSSKKTINVYQMRDNLVSLCVILQLFVALSILLDCLHTCILFASGIIPLVTTLVSGVNKRRPRLFQLYTFYHVIVTSLRTALQSVLSSNLDKHLDGNECREINKACWTGNF